MHLICYPISYPNSEVQFTANVDHTMHNYLNP